MYSSVPLEPYATVPEMELLAEELLTRVSLLLTVTDPFVMDRFVALLVVPIVTVPFKVVGNPLPVDWEPVL